MKTTCVRVVLASGFLLACGLLRAQTATTTTLTSIVPAEPRFGQTVTMAAQVVPAAAPGTVSFVDRGVLVGVGTLNSSGFASVSTITLTPGEHAFQAIYGGSAGYQASRSAASNYTVTAVPGTGFRTQMNYAVGVDWEMESVAVGDFNGDGKADLAMLHWNSSGSVSVMLGTGQGSFQAPVNYSVGAYPSSVVVGDFNGDGKADLAVANYGNFAAGPQLGTVSVLLGNGDGTFQPATVFPAGGYGPSSIAIADFNGDGKADLAVANVGSGVGNAGNVSVLLGNGDGTFQTATSYLGGSLPSFVAVSDVNGDGDPDLLVGQSTGVSVLLGNGDGSFRVGASYAVGGSFPSSIAVGDFNGDGKPDMAATGSGYVYVLVGNGDGTFQSAAPFAAGADPVSVAVGDFNGDGKTDLAVANSQSDNVSVLLGNGNGTFQTAVNYAAGSGPDTVVVGDFNGDGVADLALVSDFSSNVSVLIGAGPGSALGTPTATTMSATPNPSQYGQPVTITAEVTPSGVSGQVEFLDGATVLGVAPLDGSGQAQIVTNEIGAGPRSLRAGYLGEPGVWQPSDSGAVSQVVSTVSGDGFAPAGSYATGTNPVSVAAGDFNGDGKTDLAVANSGSNSVSVLLGNGDGTFKAAVNYGTGTDPQFVAAADFNGDGFSDLAVANYDGSVSILLGNGDGTFRTGVSYSTGTRLAFLGTGDFNGDGRLDLAIPYWSNPGIFVALGNGDGSFQAALNFNIAVSEGLQPLAVGDFNGDGVADLAVVTTNSVSVLLGNGDGTFQAAVSYAVASALSVTTGDFNGDGHLDLAVTNDIEPTTIGVLLGNGDGTFQPAVNSAESFFAFYLAAGDFNGDGKTDLAAVADGNTGVELLLGNGDGTFQTPRGFSVGNFPYAAATADFNGDGRADLAVVNNVDGNVSILLGMANGNDFNRDGHPDVIWEEPEVGWAQVWYLGGSEGASLLGAADLTQANPWNIVGVGDFNSDGAADVVWQDPVSGAVQVWYLGGAGGVTLISAADITTNNPWKVVSVADFNRDGHPDLLWQDPVSGWAQIWYLGGPQGTTLLGAADLTKSNPWRIVGTGDFNSDGSPDVLWQDPVSGTVQIWYLGGDTPGSQGSVLESALNLTGPMTTKVVAIADFNQDGHPDVIFQDTATGAATVYYYTGSTGTTANGTAVLSTGNPWYIAGPH
jgi:hypothetical protein